MHLKINYPPNFQARYGYGKPAAKYIEAIFERNRDVQFNFLETMKKFAEKFAAIEIEEPEDSIEPRWRQPWFPPLDGMSLYALLAEKAPNTYIEIGSGNSTKFAARSIRDNGLKTKLISIDPEPRAEVNELCDLIYRNRLEDMDLSVFDAVTSGDVVLFDGSHRCLQNSDVTAFFIDVLPMLPAGVIVGVHDIFWPIDYPDKWVDRYYSEQYILGAYMLALGADFPLIFSSGFIGARFGREARECFPQADRAKYASAKINPVGGMLWFSKPDTRF